MCSGMMSAGRRVLDDERCVVPDRAVILTRRAFRRAVMDGSFRYRAKDYNKCYNLRRMGRRTGMRMGIGAATASCDSVRAGEQYICLHCVYTTKSLSPRYSPLASSPACPTRSSPTFSRSSDESGLYSIGNIAARSMAKGRPRCRPRSMSKII